MNIFKASSIVTAFLGLAAHSPAQVIEKKSLTMDGARQVIAAAVAEANNKKATGVIAVVDEGGNLMALEPSMERSRRARIYRSAKHVRRCSFRSRRSSSKTS